MLLGDLEIKSLCQLGKKRDLAKDIKTRSDLFWDWSISAAIIGALSFILSTQSFDDNKKLLASIEGLISIGMISSICGLGISKIRKDKIDNNQINEIDMGLLEFINKKTNQYQEKLNNEKEQIQEYVNAFYKNNNIQIQTNENVINLIVTREILEEQKELLKTYDLTNSFNYSGTTNLLDENIKNLEDKGISRNLRLPNNN